MKLTFILLSVMLCLVYVSGRHVHDADSEERNVEEDSVRQPSEQSRHRRRSRQSFYDFNYPPFYEYNRRDSSRQEEMYSQILRLLDDLSSYIKRPPPPPPQPMYIPYPVPYFVPQYISCGSKKPTNGTDFPAFGVRWPIVEDQNQIWSLIPGDTGENDGDADDGKRPILLEPILPSVPISKPPPVEHGSEQAGLDVTTRASTTVQKPGVCQAAILTCCNLNKSQRQICFENYGCSKTFSTGNACHPEILKKVLEAFVKVYAPNNEA